MPHARSTISAPAYCAGPGSSACNAASASPASRRNVGRRVPGPGPRIPRRCPGVSSPAPAPGRRSFGAAPSEKTDAGHGWLRVQLEQPGVLGPPCSGPLAWTCSSTDKSVMSLASPGWIEAISGRNRERLPGRRSMIVATCPEEPVHAFARGGLAVCLWRLAAGRRRVVMVIMDSAGWRYRAREVCSRRC